MNKETKVRHEIILGEDSLDVFKSFLNMMKKYKEVTGFNEKEVRSIDAALNKFSMIKEEEGEDILSVMLTPEDLVFLCEGLMAMIPPSVEDTATPFFSFLENIRKNHPKRVYKEKMY